MRFSALCAALLAAMAASAGTASAAIVRPFTATNNKCTLTTDYNVSGAGNNIFHTSIVHCAAKVDYVFVTSRIKGPLGKVYNTDSADCSWSTDPLCGVHSVTAADTAYGMASGVYEHETSMSIWLCNPGTGSMGCDDSGPDPWVEVPPPCTVNLDRTIVNCTFEDPVQALR
jgi:hypothetical protein